MDAHTDFRLLNDFQHHFPLTSRPFATLGQELGLSEGDVRYRLAVLQAEGKISRIGAVFTPGRIGCSTLAAMSIPENALKQVAETLNTFPEINHNYEREHHYNLWFVVTASHMAHLEDTLQRIELLTGYPILRLPLLEAFHIDLGFSLGATRQAHETAIAPAVQDKPMTLTAAERQLVSVLQEGLPLHPTPYQEVAQHCGYTESALRQQLAQWQQSGIIKRFGIIVRHHELGFGANAMLVHDIPDEAVSSIGRELASEPAITLCYRRPRALPGWRYNLFCMIHGRQRQEVEARIAEIRQRHGLTGLAHEVLFSRRRFKQQGARYA